MLFENVIIGHLFALFRIDLQNVGDEEMGPDEEEEKQDQEEREKTEETDDVSMT